MGRAARARARSPKDCDTYASVQSSYDDLASLASERCCDEDPRSPDAALDDAYAVRGRARRAAADADAEPTTFDASTTPPPGLRVHARRPAQAATPLDVFLRLRGLDAHADVLYALGARKIGDLRYLRKRGLCGRRPRPRGPRHEGRFRASSIRHPPFAMLRC